MYLTNRVQYEAVASFQIHFLGCRIIHKQPCGRIDRTGWSKIIFHVNSHMHIHYFLKTMLLISYKKYYAFVNNHKIYCFLKAENFNREYGNKSAHLKSIRFYFKCRFPRSLFFFSIAWFDFVKSWILLTEV